MHACADGEVLPCLEGQLTPGGARSPRKGGRDLFGRPPHRPLSPPRAALEGWAQGRHAASNSSGHATQSPQRHQLPTHPPTFPALEGALRRERPPPPLLLPGMQAGL